MINPFYQRKPLEWFLARWGRAGDDKGGGKGDRAWVGLPGLRFFDTVWSKREIIEKSFCACVRTSNCLNSNELSKN